MHDESLDFDIWVKSQNLKSNILNEQRKKKNALQSHQ
jgi:hypothetical protein